jgi:hypothetical protein
MEKGAAGTPPLFSGFGDIPPFPARAMQAPKRHISMEVSG